MKLLNSLFVFPDTTFIVDKIYYNLVIVDYNGIYVILGDHHKIRKTKDNLSLKNPSQEINIKYFDDPLIQFTSDKDLPKESNRFKLFCSLTNNKVYKYTYPSKVNLDMNRWKYLLLTRRVISLEDIESMLVKQESIFQKVISYITC